MSRPAVKLSELRRIGWTVWDPIALFDLVGSEFNKGPADEYDRYLTVAFGLAQSGKSEVEIVGYLAEIAFEHMGLSKSAELALANRETATALTKLAGSLT